MFAVGRVSNENVFIHRDDNPQNQAWLTAFREAKREVFVETPDFLTRNVVDAAIATVRRGVNVTVITNLYMGDEAEMFYTHSYRTNRRMARKVYEQLRNEPEAKALMRICWFIGKRMDPPRPTRQEWTHVKAMTVDDEVAIVGTGNHDPQSWYHSRENNLVIDDMGVTRHIKAKLLRDQTYL